ncbi:MAG: hypothetical protein ACYDAO_01705 [Thermoplasmataceae archaeon]
MTFWRREKDTEKGVMIHHCDEHNIHTYKTEEIEEHEKMHAIEESGLRAPV